MLGIENPDWDNPFEDDHRMTRLFGRLLLLATVISLGSIFLWAALASIDSITRGDAQVVPSAQKQIVQNLEGGILAELLVHDGQEVEAGQTLLIIANSITDAEVGDLKQKELTLQARIARLEAEANGVQSSQDIQFPAHLAAQAENVLISERAQFDARLRELQSQLGVLQDRLQQRQQEIEVTKGRLVRLREALALAEKEHATMRPMLESGAVSKIEMLGRERQMLSLKAEIDAANLTVPSAEAGVREAQNQIAAQMDTYRSRAYDELAQNKLELAAVAQRMIAGADRKLRTEVKSPVKGRINEVKVRTINGVIAPGQDLVEIIPEDDSLTIEARMSPADIAFVHPGQKAKIKISAYDYSIYGGVEGTVERVSADAIVNAKGESFYRVYLRTKVNYLGPENKPLPIIPGMTGTVEVLTGERTIMDKITAPVRQALAVAFTER